LGAAEPGLANFASQVQQALHLGLAGKHRSGLPETGCKLIHNQSGSRLAERADETFRRMSHEVEGADLSSGDLKEGVR
jgi:hypothetical protein